MWMVLRCDHAFETEQMRMYGSTFQITELCKTSRRVVGHICRY